MSIINIHDEWLSLLDISGTFLAPPVLKEVYPQGLDALDGLKRKRLRQTHEEWNDSYLAGEKEFPKIHEAWIKEVLISCLDYGHGGGQFLKSGQDIPASLYCPIAEYGATLSPEYALIDLQREKPNLLLIQSYPRDVDLNKLIKYEHYSATPVDQMVQLCRASQCRLGLVTNGENWVLIDAPVGSMSTSAGWQARLWIQESISLQSFVHLLGISRFFVSTEEQLPALIDRSLQYQDEVTSALGTQIQRAIEVLIQSLDKYDLESGRTLLIGVTERELYEAALTVMMRLVFLLSAEERGLLLLDEGAYQKNYALSTLRMQLRNEGPEILELRKDAWSRLLALFRMVYGGAEHDSFRLPALGGSLFDPDRFTFLEGRAKGTSWKIDESKPLPIDNRTVLLLLEAIQQFEGRTLSYRSLDVEQIGYVYEGLLERTVKRTSEVILDVGATRNAEKPLVSLNELEAISQSGITPLETFLVERSGSSISRIRNELSKPVEERLSEKLLTACAGDPVLRDQIKPYANLLRNDSWGYPLVYPAGSYVVTSGSDRRETGSHYTPKSLTEAIVTETLTPVVYVGPAEGLPRENWKLKSPEEILDLKICDPAMGSGAFLVQVCRWLSDRLIDSWANVEAEGLVINSEGQTKKSVEASELMPPDLEARIVIARRLIAERCLYGVDFNPLAVELAKLSIWLITLSKGRPFGFLDHNLRHGDSLLGLQNLEQLVELSMNPTERIHQGLFIRSIRNSVDEAIELRKNLRSQPVRNIHDVELMTKLNMQAREKLNIPNLIADAFIGSILKFSGNTLAVRAIVDDINISASSAFEGVVSAVFRLEGIAQDGLSIELLPGRTIRKPFHWPLEFPEVFQRNNRGFDAIVGNPPYLGGKKITGFLGKKYRDWMVQYLATGRKGNADLCAYFLLRSCELLGLNSCYGLVGTTSLAEGETREVGLDALTSKLITIYRSDPNRTWPGKASVTYSLIYLTKINWGGNFLLNGEVVNGISSALKINGKLSKKPEKLLANKKKAFIGSFIYGQGFVITEDEAESLLRKDSKNEDVIFPYLIGKEFNSSPQQSPKSWVINFDDMSLNDAEKYVDCMKIVRSKVKPERDLINDKKIKENWWQFGRRAIDLYKTIYGYKRVLFHSFTSKYTTFGFVPANIIYAAPNVVIAFEDFSHFAVLQSIFHEVWVREYTSYSLSIARYTPSECFETFPFPKVHAELEEAGLNYYKLRENICIQNNLGFVEVYNKFHDPGNADSEIVELRKLQLVIDNLVLQSYGWSDMTIERSFCKTSRDGVRFFTNDILREKILDQLLELNYSLSTESFIGNVDLSNKSSRLKKVKVQNFVDQNTRDLFD
jgi:hypothetical protein